MRPAKPRIRKRCCGSQIPLLNLQGHSTGRAQVRFAGSSAKRSRSRNYRGQFRQIAISNPMYEQRLVVRGADPVTTLVCFGRSIGSPAILSGAEWLTVRRNEQGNNRQQTQRPQRPSRNSNSHHLWHFYSVYNATPAVSLRQPIRRRSGRQFRLGDCTGVSQAACLKSVVNPSGPRKMTLNEENEDLLFCAEASRLALRGGGFACHSCSARSGSPLSLLSPVLVLSCHCRRCCPSPRSGGMHSSSISIAACSLASSASS